MKKYILALDQGTTSSRAMLFDREQHIVGSAQREFTQFYPKAGWVEHDPMEIYSSQYAVMMELLTGLGLEPDEIAAIGIANQRETTILWERDTGKPVYNAIVWQCRRSAAIVDALVEAGHGEYIRSATGLTPDAYFSGSKIKWLLDSVPGLRERAEKGEILFGTVDTWLIWRLTEGAVHVSDYSNASRTMLFNIHSLDWDDKLLSLLDIPRVILPQVRSSSEVYGMANIQGVEVPIAGCAGDQQAALFGQCCFEAGRAKNTYGTGCFLLMNTGDAPISSKNGLLTTIAATLPGLEAQGRKVQYALEGSVFVGGAVVQWLRDEMRLIDEAADVEYYASRMPDNGGVYFVPAFTGLGAPYWDQYARGAIVGLTRGSKRGHIIRAAEEAIAYQTLDLIRAMEADTGAALNELRVDGGASRDSFLMQFQADIMQGNILRPEIRETTALGAAFLAGLALGFWSNLSELESGWNCDAVYRPGMEESERERLISGWRRAVQRSR
jgi:glycerol kinase